MLLANGHFAGVTPAIFVIFVDFRGPRSKIPCFCGQNAISEFLPIFVKTTCCWQGTKRPFSKTTVSTTLTKATSKDLRDVGDTGYFFLIQTFPLSSLGASMARSLGSEPTKAGRRGARAAMVLKSNPPAGRASVSNANN